MKIRYLVTLVFATLLIVFSQANAEETTITRSQVPDAVIHSFENDYPYASGLEFEKEMLDGQTVYEVKYENNGKEFGYLYSADGDFIQKSQN